MPVEQEMFENEQDLVQNGFYPPDIAGKDVINNTTNTNTLVTLVSDTGMFISELLLPDRLGYLFVIFSSYTYH